MTVTVERVPNKVVEGRSDIARVNFIELKRVESRMSAFIFESVSTLSRRVLYDFIWFYAI